LLLAEALPTRGFPCLAHCETANAAHSFPEVAENQSRKLIYNKLKMTY
jgi:hypothetical protein